LCEEDERFAGWHDTSTNEFLAEHIAMEPRPGAQKSRFEMLLSPEEMCIEMSAP